jgi:hypothetical protein
MLASGNLYGYHYLEDIIEISIQMARTNRMPPMYKWVTGGGVQNTLAQIVGLM